MKGSKSLLSSIDISAEFNFFRVWIGITYIEMCGDEPGFPPEVEIFVSL